MSTVNLKSFVNQYEFPFTIPSSKAKITFKPITTGQMKNLLVYEEESITTIEKVLDDILIGCVVTNGFDLDALTLQDRFNLLIEVRKKSKGSTYNFQTKCSKCNIVGPKGIELDKLVDKPFVKPTETIVKISDTMSIELDYITRKHQREASEIVEVMKGLNDKQMLAEIASYTYALAITKFITPDNEFTQADVELQNIVEMLNCIDEASYARINQWFVDNDYGIIFKADYMCSSCGHKEVIDIPVAYFFS